MKGQSSRRRRCLECPAKLNRIEPKPGPLRSIRGCVVCSEGQCRRLSNTYQTTIPDYMSTKRLSSDKPSSHIDDLICVLITLALPKRSVALKNTVDRARRTGARRWMPLRHSHHPSLRRPKTTTITTTPITITSGTGSSHIITSSPLGHAY